VVQIADYPGLLVWRTVAMIANEALDALQKGVASEKDIDTAMRLGVNYPSGPIAWGERLGWQRLLRCWRTCNAITAKNAIAPVHCCASGASGE
jgi:3-hydroxyacyl-CoA dehydrogenase